MLSRLKITFWYCIRPLQSKTTFHSFVFFFLVGSSGFTSFQKTYTYSMYTGLQRSNPEENVARLNISDPNFSTLIESGDKLVLYQTKYIHV
jgi:hypothetical protein